VTPRTPADSAVNGVIMAALPGSSASALTGNQFPDHTGGRHPDGTGRLPIPCVYCRQEIEASSFTFWSTMGLLLSATCASCHRRMTLRRSTWALLSDPRNPGERRGGPPPGVLS
jgi:hypothetical protein